jgi:RNA polymerase primary sigma factor
MADPVADTERAAIGRAFSEELQHLLEDLRPIEARVLRLRYGLEGAKPHSAVEVASTLAVSHSCIRRIETRALSRLRHLHPAFATA